jgi:Bacteriophage minor capsid protein
MLLDDMATMILAASTSLKLGGSTGSKTPVFLSRIPPDQVSLSVGVYEAGGPPPQYVYGGITFERPSVQVLVRAASYEAGRNLADTIYQYLSTVTNSTVSSTLYVSVTPQQSPFDAGYDANDRRLISCNYIIEKELST